MPRFDLEYFPTPAAYTRWLFDVVPLSGRILEPCVGDGAILRAAPERPPIEWITNDLDPDFEAHYHEDASTPAFWVKFSPGQIDSVVSNLPFTPAIDITSYARRTAKDFVCMHLRASIHEPLKTGIRRSWMARWPPAKILWLPRFAYQRSPTTGTWTTDSVCACWCVWNCALGRTAPQEILYAPESVFEQLDRETERYRENLDHIMGFTGPEAERRKQRIALTA